MVAVYEELVRPRVMAAVEDLVAREASGVLEVTGDPSGAIYLDGGRIAFAGSSWVPGLAARLRAIAPAVANLRPLSSGRDSDDASLAGYAVQHGYLTPAALHELIRSTVIDAFLVLTVPLSADSPVAAIRFTSTRTYWTEMFPRLDFGLVRGEALRRAERMAEHGLSPTTAVALRDLRAPAAVLTREQWAVACQIGEHASALDLAARRGAGLSDTIDCLGKLTEAGLCGPVRISGRARQLTRGLRPVPPPPPPPPAPPAGVPPVQTLPARVPPVHATPASPAPVPPAPAGRMAGEREPAQAPILRAAPAQAAPVQAPSVQAPSVQWTPGEQMPAGLLPFRHPGQDVPPRSERPVTQAPTMDILRQVLSGLRKL